MLQVDISQRFKLEGLKEPNKTIFISINMGLIKEKPEKDLYFQHGSDAAHFITIFAGGCTRYIEQHPWERRVPPKASFYF